jgi:hypothetical protein
VTRAASAVRVTRAIALLAATLALGAGACKKTGDALILLDLRASGTFPAPVASVRLSVPWQADAGWPSHVVATDLGPAGFKFGYYLPGGGSPITVQAEALDDASCILGSGSLTLPAPPAGGTSAEMTLYLRPLADSMCVDAGTPPPPDAGADAPADGGAPDAPAEAGTSDAADAPAADAPTTDAPADAPTADAPGSDAPAADAPAADAPAADAPAADAQAADAAASDAAGAG